MISYGMNLVVWSFAGAREASDTDESLARGVETLAGIARCSVEVVMDIVMVEEL
jgi:hypothetical protein